MTVGPLLVAAAMLLLTGITPDSTYVTGVLPGIVVFGLGLALTVAPLTATALGAVDDHHAGVASGVNNAVARTGQLLAVAAIPADRRLRAGRVGRPPTSCSTASTTVMRVAAITVVGAAAIAWLTVRRPARAGRAGGDDGVALRRRRPAGRRRTGRRRRRRRRLDRRRGVGDRRSATMEGSWA